MYALLSAVQMHPVTSQRPCKEPSQEVELIAAWTASLDFPPAHPRRKIAICQAKLELGAKSDKDFNEARHKEQPLRKEMQKSSVLPRLEQVPQSQATSTGWYLTTGSWHKEKSCLPLPAMPLRQVPSRCPSMAMAGTNASKQWDLGITKSSKVPKVPRCPNDTHSPSTQHWAGKPMLLRWLFFLAKAAETANKASPLQAGTRGRNRHSQQALNGLTHSQKGWPKTQLSMFIQLLLSGLVVAGHSSWSTKKTPPSPSCEEAMSNHKQDTAT